MKSVLSICLLVVFICSIEAGDRKSRGRGAWAWANATESAKPVPTPTASSTPAASECTDALDEVNAERAKRGLAAFKRDAQLTAAALACARERASRGIHGHLESDFVHLPAGVSTNGVAAGCAAWEDGFGACAMYDNYTHCGAAWVRGSDGLKYCHIFVSGAPTVESAPQVYQQSTVSAGTCADGSCGTATYSRRRGIFGRR